VRRRRSNLFCGESLRARLRNITKPELFLCLMDIFQLLGPPSTSIGSTLLWRYGDSSFFVRADDTHQRVVQVAVYNDASFHTAEGARYGSTLQDLNRIWGSPYKWSRTHFCLIGESRSRLALTKQGSFSFLTSVRRDGFAARGYFTVRGRP
jgi:hypothetical protein